ncbi:ribosomal protein S18 acetylase RimI-like enzyme [Streptomyces sp. KhCrAH-43]|uniref:GNAT family N-acetyltransferase n=1 Tax=unclassified Streptomyces TaxID=2593676 RepID=UPI00037DA8DC|nr:MULTISPECIES: GNAT family N-acetyltransferase [unclassified Streptomyces]MYS33399.1 GNAT family N-acetyltransferase [Streptomyces sp. SID4920]MYX64043.1 GNAT family N-acetyltransferase [Streptomyces sp. SID8373]RAJ49793.1 ribosomal protein S18 acetylase RimI-like enzyme [Streptomyces sp. KhCrAH-43]
MGRQKKNKPRRATPGPLTVRDALQEDIPGICATMPDAYGLMGGAPWRDPDYVAAGLASCAKGLSGREKIKVARLGETVVGSSFSRLALAPDGATAHTEIGIIHGIAVRPENRRQGAATALLAECEEYLRREGARVMITEARPGAVAFFSAHGFQAEPGPAFLIPSAAGMYVHPQSIPSTTLMWKNQSARPVVAESAARGTALTGVLDA